MRKRMPCGVDFGLGGGLVALDGAQVFAWFHFPVYTAKLTTVELDESHAKAVARLTKAPPKPIKEDKKRYAKGKNFERTPGSIRLFDEEAFSEQLMQLYAAAVEHGYTGGLFVLVEAPMIRTGLSSVKTYFGSGRCQNACYGALSKLGIPFALVQPSSWKGRIGLTSDKADSTQLAAKSLQLPDELKEDHDLCEAALLANYLSTYAPRYLDEAG